MVSTLEVFFVCAENVYRIFQWYSKSKFCDFFTVSALKVCRSKPHYYHYSLIDPSSSTCQFFSDDAKLTSREGYLEGQANSDTSTRVLKQSSCVSDDFFGFENGEGVVIVNEEEDMDEEQVNVVEKYSRLFEKKPAPAEEKVFVTNFGSIRYDSDNPPHPHKDQPEYASTESMEEQEVNYETESGFIEGQYFSEGQRKDEVSSEQPFMNSGNYIEEHYFGSSGVKDSLLCHSTSWDDVGPTTSNLSSEFGVHSNLINRVNQNGDIESIRTKSDFQRLRIHANRELENEPINTKKRNEDLYNLESKSEETDMGKIKMTPLEKKSMERMKANIRMPQTAYDFVARLRTQETVNDKGTIKDFNFCLYGDGLFQ